MKKNLSTTTVMMLVITMMCAFMFTACSESADPVATTEATEAAATTEQVTTAADQATALANLETLEQKNIAFVDLYNEIATLATDNGWGADELTVKELDAADTIIQLVNSIILDQTGIVQADIDDFIVNLDAMAVDFDTNVRARVTEQYSAQ